MLGLRHVAIAGTGPHTSPYAAVQSSPRYLSNDDCLKSVRFGKWRGLWGPHTARAKVCADQIRTGTIIVIFLYGSHIKGVHGSRCISGFICSFACRFGYFVPIPLTAPSVSEQ
ncbi:Hypothetical predicted protein [Olea europaea subsp. europaea]|uniref:Uncharacterized protein n=1 Tax=Olea europaea subsp. europaea TaxID=158383 RepID=A0A8S0UWS7_OLEEU|nr:Hypothetical predicted protein [Olea europaea subsp. europaea]